MANQSKKAWKDMSPSERVKEAVIYIIAVGVVCGLPIWFFVSVNNTPKPEPSPFTSLVGESHLVDPSTRNVSYTVTNSGNVPQKANCYVTVQNSGGNYSGWSTGTTEILNPGETKTFKRDITISNQGAAYITEGSVICQVK